MAVLSGAASVDSARTTTVYTSRATPMNAQYNWGIRRDLISGDLNPIPDLGINFGGGAQQGREIDRRTTNGELPYRAVYTGN
jgi:hypothetical protein